VPRRIFSVMQLRKVAVALCAALLLAASPAQEDSLVQVLQQIAHLDEASLIAVSNWASYSNPQPPDTPMSDLDQVEVEAVKLPPQDQDALFTWLNHGGRSKLYALGITDGEIGPCQPLIDGSKACKSPTVALAPIAARSLAFRSAAQAASGVEISGGFATLSPDATALTQCIAFKNVTGKKIAAITFTYALLDASGNVATAGSDIVVGSFDGGSQTTSPLSLGDFQTLTAGGGSPPSNCWTKSTTLSKKMQPAIFNVAVSSVTFEDGSRWPQ
jgi:hypothetical protein